MIKGERASNRGRVGLTLTEVTIVLGAVGLLTATIWTIVGSVWQDYNMRSLKENLFTTVQNVQNFYGTTAGLDVATGTDITVLLDDDTRRLIPIAMRSTPTVAGNPINHDLEVLAGGSFHVFSVNNGSAFRVTLSGLSKDECEMLLMQFPVLLPELGVIRIASQAQNAAVDTNNPAAPSAIALPMTLGTADAWCPIIATNTNEVSYDFKVRP
ncbi:MAG: hypothetical protein EOM37_07985 [Proteobacteria bacterium]|jgi:hypothetical protein|nr:hypothetical protein [Alphaproteobacteria bacterium]NCC03965.1 hypothetical protein [Pseudomonadota bacterium]